MPRIGFSFLLVCLALLAGCAQFNVNRQMRYETLGTKLHGNSGVAEKKHKRALVLLRKCEFQKSEQLLREALLADVNYGPAHNTLGKVYFDQKKFYLAAWEFEYAVNVMPERPEPYNNLGLVYEAVGRLDRAVEQYEMASSHAPQNAEYLGNLLRARIRRDDNTSDLRPMLEELVLLDSRTKWVDWARQQLIMGNIDEETVSTEFYFPTDEEQKSPSTELAPPSNSNIDSDQSPKLESLPDPDFSSRRRDD